MGFHFFAMISRMKYINRWSLMRNVRIENISEHSHDVAVLSHVLALLTNKRFGGNVNVERCVLLALYHDMPEILTGDLPAPVKYFNPEIRDAYKHIERISGEKLLTMLPEDLREEYTPLLVEVDHNSLEHKIVRAADKLSALIKCIEEEGQGNREFNKARRATEKAVRDLNLPAADCFVREFLPSYFLTLDEQD